MSPVPKVTRVCIIIQLCLAFTYLFWAFTQPFLKERISKKSQMALFEAVLDHTAFHEELSLEQQQTIIKGYETLKRRNDFPSLSFSLFGLT